MNVDESRSIPPDRDPIETTRQTMMYLNEQVTPIREWFAGQRAYFTGQGYTSDEARAIAAALFVTVFDTKITTKDD